jgi:hypothetical protein
MNEKPGLEPGFFLDELLAAGRATRSQRRPGMTFGERSPDEPSGARSRDPLAHPGYPLHMTG